MYKHHLNEHILEQDYESTSIKKDLIIQSSDHPSHQFQVHIPYDSETRELDLGRVLHTIFTGKSASPIVLPHNYRYQIFYYSNDSGYFIFGGMYPFQQLLLLGEEFIPLSYIYVKINRVQPPQIALVPEDNKKKRINDRSIKEVLEKVAEWRKIQQQNGITLEQAAKWIDMPKKTLDDYFYQIKQGQEYGFDFEANEDKKIGVLRKYVRENHKKIKQQDKGSVKILQQFMNLEHDEQSEGEQPQQEVNSIGVQQNEDESEEEE